MNKVAPNKHRVRVVRNLTSNPFFSMMSAFKNQSGRVSHPDIDFNVLGDNFYKIKSRLDSYGVFSQAVPDSDGSSAALALLGSVFSQIIMLEEAMGLPGIKSEIDVNKVEIEREISLINEQGAHGVVDNRSPVYKSSNGLWGRLKKIVTAEAAIYVCLLVAKDYFSTLDLNPNGGLENIVREISFSPEYHQAGISILSYFSEIIKDRYPDIEVSISIKQSGSIVTMIITFPDGSREEISKILHQYGLVITGQASPAEVASSELKAMALQQKLELARLEVKQVRDLLDMERRYSERFIGSLQSDVAMLKEMLGRELSANNDLSAKLLMLASDLSSNNASHQVIHLMKTLGEAFSADDKSRGRVILNDVKDLEPDFFEKMHAFLLSSTASGIVGNVATDWLKVVLSGFPK